MIILIRKSKEGNEYICSHCQATWIGEQEHECKR